MAWDEMYEFFSLETLDTRLEAPTETKKKSRIQEQAPPVSKWNTTEFKVYGVVFAMAVPWMFKTAMDASNETNANYSRFQHLLLDGWMFGRKVDNSDAQYRFFRSNFFLLMGLVAIHFGLRKATTSIIRKRTTFDFLCGIVFLFGAHGFNSLRIIIHILVNWIIGQYVSHKKVAIGLTWGYGILTLFLNHWFRNTPIGIDFIDSGFKGIVARWDVFFNFTMLRMLSFNLDYLERKEKVQDPETIAMEKKLGGGTVTRQLDDRERLTAPLALNDYNFVNYIAYLFYLPLFIAGPIITFNDYIFQSNYQPLASVLNYKRTAIYFGRFLFCVLVMEFLLHFMYVVAVSKTKAWEGDSVFEISMIGYFNLNIIWLKLLIPWRLFRFWSLLDGIDPPENMIRCMSNNYSALAFWRAWHRSYNRWVIRYIYIPMGGGGRFRIINSLLVFTFVAIWHDIELKLLMWGWLVVIFLIPEIAATAIFNQYKGQWWYRYACSIGAVFNIWMMMIANLSGFCLGQEGVLLWLKQMYSTPFGALYFFLSLGALFVGSQVMFETRNSEHRRGVNVKC